MNTEKANAAGPLHDRAVLVTGASDGIGRAVALAAAAQGARVALLGRSRPKLESAYDAIVAAGGPTPSICQFDLATDAWKDYETLAACLDAEYGRLDGLVHCAAQLGRLAPVEHIDPETWKRVLHVNVTAAFLLTKACLPLLRRADEASVIFTSSSAGRRGSAYWGTYATTKFAIDGFMQVLADELESGGKIRVNSMNPGKTRTAMRRAAYPDEDPATLPLPEEVAPAFVRLLGPEGRGITGRALDAR